MLVTGLIIDQIKEISGFKSCIIVGQDGLPIDSFISDDTDKNLLSALVSSMFEQITKQSNRFNKKNPKTSIIETDSAVLSITKIPIDGEPFVVFSEFEFNSESIYILNSINKISI